MPTNTQSSTSQDYYRTSPFTLPAEPSRQSQHPNITMQNMPQSYPPTYATGGPVQPLQYHQAIPQSAPLPSRASSGAWTPADDITLMNARAQGHNWAPIQAKHFPTKTPNACRKRHERLMDRRNSDDWDAVKLETLAKEYMSMRREIWGPLGAKTGEKWSVVEAKCMSSGLKNLQSASRACARRERLENASGSGLLPVHHPGHPEHEHDLHGAYGDLHTDDSGIGLDELEAEYHSAETASYGQSSLSPDEETRSGMRGYSTGGGSRGYDGKVYQQQQQQQQMMQDSRGMERGGDRGYVQQGQMQRPQYGMQQRLPSIDMGIGAIINRPPGGL